MTKVILHLCCDYSVIMIKEKPTFPSLIVFSLTLAVYHFKHLSGSVFNKSVVLLKCEIFSPQGGLGGRRYDKILAGVQPGTKGNQPKGTSEEEGGCVTSEKITFIPLTQ